VELFSQIIAVGDPKDRRNPKELDDAISRLQPMGLLEHLCRIGIELTDLPHENATAYQLSLIDRYSSPSDFADLREQLTSGALSAITTPDQVANLLLYIIAHTEHGPAPYHYYSIPSDGTLIRTLLLFNYYGLINPETNRFYFDDVRLQIEFSQIAKANERFLNRAYRYLMFFEWSDSLAGRQSKDSLPLRSDMADITHLSSLEYATAAWIIEAFLTEANKLLEIQYPWFNVDAYFKNESGKAKIVTFTELHQFNRDQLRLAFPSGAPSEFCREGFLWLWTHPIYYCDGSNLVVSKDAVDNTVGSGLYYLLFDYYKAKGAGEHLRLTRLFGEFFESYVFDIFRRISDRTKDIVFAERNDAGVKSTDAIVINDDTAMFVEVFSGRVPIGAITGGDPVAMRAALHKCVFKKARQLESNISRFKKGLLKLDGVHCTAVKNIYPLIVMPHAFPRSRDIQSVIDTELKAVGYLQDFAGLEIIESETLEGLEDHLSSEMPLASLIDRKLAEARADSFKNFVIDSGVVPGLRAGARMTKRLDEWIADILGTVNALFPDEKIFS
jgi:hypothetical protein